MKLYGKRFLKNSINNKIALRSETQDAVLWSVNTTTKVCSVKIQGSNQLINAYYPENYEKIPSWLKPGNAVKIMHTGGNRGRIEIIGNGILIPTPLTGSTTPTLTTAKDCILSGCNVYPAFDDPQMVVLVGTGSYRINGTVYTLLPITCDSEVYDAAMGGTIDLIAGAFAVPVAPAAGTVRIDLIEVVVDGLLHYLTGTPSVSPIAPTLSSSHVQCKGKIVVNCGTTIITSNEIDGITYSMPIPYSLSITFDPESLPSPLTDSIITVSVYDQYGALISGFHKITAEIISGTSTINGGSSAVNNGYFSYSSTTFNFVKSDDPEEYHSMVRFTLTSSNPEIMNMGLILFN